MSTYPHSRTADFLRRAIDAADKTQREIARDAGLPHPNVLSMMKTGECKVPISRIPGLAAALSIDASEMIDVAMREYHPDLWMILNETYAPTLETTERKIIETYQAVCFGGTVPWSPELEDALQAVFVLATRDMPADEC